MMASEPGFLWQVSCSLPPEAADLFEEYLRQHCSSVSSMAGVKDTLWRIEGLLESEPDRDVIERGARALARDTGFEAPTFVYDMRPPVNWLAENLLAFPPVRWKQYFIHGSHYDEPLPCGATALKLDAGTAFGSGEHATTGGCLLALDKLARKHRFERMLDVGCGSGILSIAMAKTWNGSVLAVDIDPESVIVTARNARNNQVGAQLRALESDGYKNREIALSGPYDLITANILARPLARMANDLHNALVPGGIAVISGIIIRDAPWMINVHRMVGMHLVEQVNVKGWAALVFTRR